MDEAYASLEYLKGSMDGLSVLETLEIDKSSIEDG
jgi:hypothetical protein